MVGIGVRLTFFSTLCISFLIKAKASVKSGKRKVEGEQITVLPD